VRSRPFEGPTDLETLLRVQKGDFLPPEAAAPDLEPEVAAIINRALKHDVNERYQTADEMLADLEHVLRTVFRPVGQTELKRWLTELSVHDGLPSILKGGGRQAISRTGTGELDGKDVVLSDSQELLEDEIDGEARTSLAVVEAAGGGRMRMSRQRAAQPPGLALPVPHDAESEHDGRASQELSALPIPETEEPPDRRRMRSGGGFFKLLFVGALVVGGAWFGGTYYRSWFGGGEAADQAGAAPNAGAAETKAAEKPVGEKAKVTEKSAADKDKATADKEKAKAGSESSAEAHAKTAAGEGSESAGANAEEAKADKPAREAGPRRKGATAERTPPPAKSPKDRVHSIELKNMMAPDPSLLPAPEPAPKPAPPPSDPPASE